MINDLLKVINHNMTRYRLVDISKVGNKYCFLRQEFDSLEEAKGAIDQMWNNINSKPFA